MARLSYLLITLALGAFNLWAFAKIFEVYGRGHDGMLTVMYSGLFWGPVLLCTVVMNVVMFFCILLPHAEMDAEEADDWVKGQKRKLKRFRYGKVIWKILDEIF